MNEIDRRRLARPTADLASRLKSAAARVGRVAGDDADVVSVKSTKPGRADYLSVKAALQERLLDEIGERGLLESDGADVAAAVKDFAARAIASEDIPLNEAERERLAEELTDETLGHRPAGAADGRSGRHRHPGQRRRTRSTSSASAGSRRPDVRFRDDEHIIRVIERIAARVGRRIDAASPMVDLRLPDGSRVNATIPPVTIDGPTISIRRFGRRRLRRDDLLRLGMLSQEMLDVPRSRRARAQEHPHLRRHRRRQVDAARRAGRSHPRAPSASSRSRTRPS